MFITGSVLNLSGKQSELWVAAFLLIGAAWSTYVACSLEPVRRYEFAKRWWIRAGFFALGIALFYGSYKFFRKVEISVSPDDKFSLHTGVFSEETTLYVANSGNGPAYSVWVQLKVYGDKADADGIETEIDDNVAQGPHPFNENLTVVKDANWFPGTDTEGNESYFIAFRVIPPHTTYTIVIKGKRAVKSEAVAEIMGYGRTPTGFLSTGSVKGFSLKVPRGISTRSFGIWIKPKKPSGR